MIRALFGFAMTIALVGAAALWAVGVLDPVERLQAPPPVSRTVELLASDLAERLPPLRDLASRSAAPASATPTEDTTPVAPRGELRARDEVIEPAATGEAQAHPLALDPADEAPADAIADTPSAEDVPVDSYARREALADSATLVRRMLGLYQRALDPK